MQFLVRPAPTKKMQKRGRNGGLGQEDGLIFILQCLGISVDTNQLQPTTNNQQQQHFIATSCTACKYCCSWMNGAGRIRVKGWRGEPRRHLVLTMFVLARRRAQGSRSSYFQNSGLILKLTKGMKSETNGGVNAANWVVCCVVFPLVQHRQHYRPLGAPTAPSSTNRSLKLDDGFVAV